MTANDPSNAEDANTGENNSLSFEEFLAQRTQLAEQPEGASEEEQPAEEAEELPEFTDEGESEAETEGDSDQGEDEEPEGGDEIDLLSLSPDQIRELAKKGKSRLLERIGELTAKNKELENKVQTFQLETKPKDIPQEQNPFATLKSMEDVQAKYEEIEKTLEATDALLEEYEDYAADDIIVVGDKEFTKKQIRVANRNAREAINKYLPAQGRHLAEMAKLSELEQQYRNAAAKEVPEISDEESEIGKAYKSWVTDKLVDKVKQEVPEIGFQIEYILAHAARSIFGGKTQKVPTGAGTKLKVEPPASPVSAGAARSGKNPKAKAQDAYKRFESTGSVDDWVAARIARMS